MVRMRWLIAGLLVLAAVVALSLRDAAHEATRAPGVEPRTTWRPSFRAPAAGEIRGTVSSAGVRLPAALLCAHCAGAACEGSVCASSDAAGAYVLRPLASGEYSLTCAAEGYASAVRPALVPERGSLTVDVVLEAGGGWLHGRVRSSDGEAVAGARVESQVGLGGGTADSFTETDREGAFRLWLGRRSGLVRASAPGLAPDELFVRDLTRDIELVLHPAGRLSGTVVHAESGEPLEGVRVSAGSIIGDGWGIASERTAADGTFAFASVPPGRYKPTVSESGWFGVAERAVVVTSRHAAEPVTIAARRGARVSGSVIAFDDDTPCAAGHVLARGPLEQPEMTRIDAGAFVFEGLLPGAYALTVSCRGFASLEPPALVVSDVEVTGLLYEVERGHTVSGHAVRADGSPAAEVSVRVSGGRERRSDSARTAEDGSFASEPLPPGRYTVSAGRWVRGAAGVEVDLTKGSVEGIVVRVPEAAELRGRVTDAAGRPVRALTVTLERGDRPLPVGTTDGSGVFARDRLPVGDFQLVVSHGQAKLAQKRVQLVADRATEIDVQIAGLGQALRGVVQDAAGQGVPYASVALAAEQRPADFRPSRFASLFGESGAQSVLADASGQFVFDGLTAGSYRLTARSAEGAYGEARGSPGAVVQITLQGAGGIEGTVQPAPPYFSVIAWERSSRLRRQEWFANDTGAWSLHGLPAGDWEVTAETPLGAARATVPLEGGEVVTGVELRVGARSLVSGRVVDLESGAPLAGVAVMLSTSGSMDRPRLLRTEADGGFRSTDAPSGPLVLRLREPAGYVEQTPIHATVEDGQELTLGDIRLRKKPDAERGMFGLRVQSGAADATDGLAVEWLKPGGPAEQAGLMLGDRIVAVRGQSVRGANAYLFWQLIYATNGETVRLELAGGRTVSLTAALWERP